MRGSQTLLLWHHVLLTAAPLPYYCSNQAAMVLSAVRQHPHPHLEALRSCREWLHRQQQQQQQQQLRWRLREQRKRQMVCLKEGPWYQKHRCGLCLLLLLLPVLLRGGAASYCLDLRHSSPLLLVAVLLP
jgi:hypothetical protein